MNNCAACLVCDVCNKEHIEQATLNPLWCCKYHFRFSFCQSTFLLCSRSQSSPRLKWRRGSLEDSFSQYPISINQETCSADCGQFPIMWRFFSRAAESVFTQSSSDDVKITSERARERARYSKGLTGGANARGGGCGRRRTDADADGVEVKRKMFAIEWGRLSLRFRRSLWLSIEGWYTYIVGNGTAARCLHFLISWI